MKMKLVAGLVVISTLVLGVVLYNNKQPGVAYQGEDSGADEAVKSLTLSNGLKVLVIENHRAPVVVSQVWYKVGASYEHDGITGISHVLEHMMFKGTERFPDGEFSEIVAANGGKENAFVGQDFTAFFQRIAKDRLPLLFKLEADRMQNLQFEEDEFIKEMKVVKEERRWRTDDKPKALTFERFNAVAYTNSPYRRPVVGWMEDLKTLTLDDVQQWYETWYAPNNAVLVVAGDVKAEEVFKLAKRYFGHIPASEIPQLKPRHETRQLGIQRVTVEVPAKLPYLIMGYKVPVLSRSEETQDNEWELYALEVLAGVLDGGSSARLSSNLVRGQQIAASASASYSMTSRHETLFILAAIPNDGVTIDVLEFALREEINKIQRQMPDAAELDRVKAQVVAAQVFQQDSIFYQAMEVGMLETMGFPWQIKDEYVEKILAVTAEQVQQVANKFLIDTGLTVAVLDPLPMETNSESEAASPTTEGASHAQ